MAVPYSPPVVFSWHTWVSYKFLALRLRFPCQNRLLSLSTVRTCPIRKCAQYHLIPPCMLMIQFVLLPEFWSSLSVGDLTIFASDPSIFTLPPTLQCHCFEPLIIAFAFLPPNPSPSFLSYIDTYPPTPSHLLVLIMLY